MREGALPPEGRRNSLHYIMYSYIIADILQNAIPIRLFSKVNLMMLKYGYQI